jgi:hypothetical protein
MLRLPVEIMTPDIWNRMWDWQSVERKIYYVDWEYVGCEERTFTDTAQWRVPYFCGFIGKFNTYVFDL